MIHLEIQIASHGPEHPSPEQFRSWLQAVLRDHPDDSEIVIRITDEHEMTELNQRYRDRQSATNVLSFPFEAPDGIQMDLLGDLVVCSPVVAREAEEQGKTLDAHWAHMIIHGTLHLLGYDHIEDDEAEIMERMEIDILKDLGFTNPYVMVDTK